MGQTIKVGPKMKTIHQPSDTWRISLSDWGRNIFCPISFSRPWTLGLLVLLLLHLHLLLSSCLATKPLPNERKERVVSTSGEEGEKRRKASMMGKRRKRNFPWKLSRTSSNLDNQNLHEFSQRRWIIKWENKDSRKVKSIFTLIYLSFANPFGLIFGEKWPYVVRWWWT